MFRLVLAISSALLVAGCQSVTPASVAGECHIFHDPGFAVQGKRSKDQRWVSRTQEQGIQGCKWARPKAEEANAS